MSEKLLPLGGPVEVLAARTANRHEELAILNSDFEDSYTIVTNPEVVNAAIAASPRPDLLLSHPATMMTVASVADLGRTNNFQPNMQCFGSRIYRHIDEPNFRGETEEWIGYAPVTDVELDLYFLVGARGNYDDYKQFIEANGLDDTHVMDMMMQTHISKPAFMRMWIACPELTANLMRKCVDDREAYKEIGAELFVAYTLMSQLVDKNDAYVQRPGLAGQVDEQGIDGWYLCR
jgi:hypothetical protein